MKPTANTPRSCEQLGACQSRTPACQGCRWKLAPGVIDGPYRALRRHLTAARIGKAALMLAGLAALCAMLSFAVGYFNPLGWFR